MWRIFQYSELVIFFLGTTEHHCSCCSFHKVNTCSISISRLETAYKAVVASHCCSQIYLLVVGISSTSLVDLLQVFYSMYLGHFGSLLPESHLMKERFQTWTGSLPEKLGSYAFINNYRGTEWWSWNRQPKHESYSSTMAPTCSRA